MSVESTLRVQARKLMEAGKLPNRLPDRMWGGQGLGRTLCTVCEAPVKRDEVEIEVEWSEGASNSNHYLHAPCLAALQLEIRERERIELPSAASAQSQSAPAAGLSTG